MKKKSLNKTKRVSKKNTSSRKPLEKVMKKSAFQRSEKFLIKAESQILEKKAKKSDEWKDFKYRVQYTMFLSFLGDETKKNKINREFQILPALEIPNYVDKLQPTFKEFTLKDLKRWKKKLDKHFSKFDIVKFSAESKKTKHYFLKQTRKTFDVNVDCSILYYAGGAAPGGKLVITSSDCGIEEISFKEVYDLWLKRNKNQKMLFIILDCNYSGKWAKELEKLNDESVSILASSQHNQKSKTCRYGGYFGHNVLKYLDRKSMETMNYPEEQEMIYQGNYLYLKKYSNLYFKFNSFKEMESVMKSEFKFHEVKDGSYLGYINQGMRNNWGYYKIKKEGKKTLYDGEFKDSRFSGMGTLNLPSGAKYEGNFKAGQVNGYCKEYSVNKDIYEGNFNMGIKEGKGKYTFKNKDTYNGSFKGDLPGGYGVLSLTNGNVYKGNFVEGIIHGKGEITYYNDDVYTGDWRNDEKNGKGVYTTKSWTYTGEFKDGLRHGYGVYVDKDGSKYEGNWKKGKKSGEGVFWEKNGSKIETNWAKDKARQDVLFFQKTGSKLVKL